MRIRELTIEQAIAEGVKLPYAYVRSLSAVTLGPAAPLPPVEEILEARCFSQEKEIRLTDDGDGLYALEITDGPDAVFLDQSCELLPRFGKKLIKRSYIQFDADGQGSVQCTRLAGWEG